MCIYVVIDHNVNIYNEHTSCSLQTVAYIQFTATTNSTQQIEFKC